jgi:flavin reductase (DIM6/NTAB) family NADH-FMN oxidoreductase RutF
MKTRECVINIPMAALAAKVVGCGNATGAKLDKFAKFGLTPVPAQKVRAPLIAECYASLECKVIDTTLVAKYCFFIIEVIAAWVDTAVKKPRTIHHLGKGNFMVAGERIKLPSRMK